jgi:hypothetical protein
MIIRFKNKGDHTFAALNYAAHNRGTGLVTDLRMIRWNSASGPVS